MTVAAGPLSETSTKLHRLGSFLERHQLEAVFLWNRANFAWITGGHDNHIVGSSPVGVAGILATRDKLLCICSNIEAPRFINEELAGTGIEIVSFPWFELDAARKVCRDLFEVSRTACDSDELHLGLQPLPGDFASVRTPLVPEEVARYRDGARRASDSIERAAMQIHPGMSELDIGGILDHQVLAGGCKPVVNLIACDERVFNYRHPIPTRWRLRRYAMLVLCSEFGGLISSLTRFVHFGALPDELRIKQQSIANIDACVNLATKPGRTLGEVFGDLQRAYEKEGFAGQWELHHQGGTTGYGTRDAIATPNSDVRLVSNQAVAWNPSIEGIKCEDTALVTDGKPEILTAHTSAFPTVEGKSPQGAVPRAGILIR